MGEAVSFFGVDLAELPCWHCSIDRGWRAVIRELRWSVKAVVALSMWHRLWKSDPESARHHLRRAVQAAGKSEHARKIAFYCLLASGQPGTYAPDEEAQVKDAALAMLEKAWAAGERLDVLWQKLEEAFSALAATGDGTGIDDGVAVPAGLRRRFLKQWLLRAAERILAHLQRRQRSRAAAPEDAPRRVSRGRAPPSFEYCAL